MERQAFKEEMIKFKANLNPDQKLRVKKEDVVEEIKEREPENNLDD